MDPLSTKHQTQALAPIEPGDLAQNPAAVYLASLAPGSRPTIRGALDTIAALVTNGQATALTLPWARLRYQHTAAIRARLAETYAPSTANKMLAALRRVLQEAWRLGQLSAETYHRAADIRGVKGHRELTGRCLSPGEIAALFAACANDPTPAGARDAALLALLHLGLRRQEVAKVSMVDLDPAETILVHGKGNNDRYVPLENGAAAAVADWIALRGDQPGPLLLAINKGGRILDHGITSQAVYNTLSNRARQARVTDLTPHDWRRTFASNLFAAGVDLVIVQKLMGHSDPATTARYDRRPEEAKRQAIAKIHTPYIPRGLPTDT